MTYSRDDNEELKKYWDLIDDLRSKSEPLPQWIWENLNNGTDYRNEEEYKAAMEADSMTLWEWSNKYLNTNYTEESYRKEHEWAEAKEAIKKCPIFTDEDTGEQYKIDWKNGKFTYTKI